MCPTPNGSPALGETPGYLQLTNQTTYTSSAALYDRAIPTFAGIDVVFDKWQYLDAGRPGDGLSFFAVDGSYDLTKMGSAGGGLGYIRIPHGYFGVGFDAYGNFVNTNVRTDTDSSRGCSNSHEGQFFQSVGIRGAGDGGDGYCLVATRQTATKYKLNLSGSSLDDSHQLVHVVLSPVTQSTPNPTLTVSVDFTGTGNDYRQVLSSQLSEAPASLKFGFAGSTGAAVLTQLIRMRSLSTVLPLTGLALTSQVDHSTTTGTPYTRFTTGDVVPISYTVTNMSGSVQSGLAIGGTALGAIACPATAISPGDSEQCAGSYTVTQADVAAGKVASTATATATNFERDTSSASSSFTFSTFALSLPLAVSASTGSVSSDGSTITWSLTATNPGGAPLNSLTIAVDSFTGNGTLPSVSCPASELLPEGGSMTCTVSYTVTQADIDAGRDLVVAATASAATTAGTVVSSGTESVTVTISHAPSLGLSVLVAPETVTAAGQRVDFAFEAANTGNSTLSSLSIAQNSFTGSGTAPTISCPATPFTPGTSVTCAAQYTVTQADIDSGAVPFSVTASAALAGGATVSSPEIPATITAVQTPSAPAVEAVAISPVTAAGQTITYAFHVSNPGNVTLSNLAALASSLPSETLPSDVTCSATVLAPGATTTCQRQYTVTQSDLDQGADLPLVVGFSGQTPSGSVLSADSATLSAQITQTPALALTGSSDLAAATGAGQSLAFSLQATNTGNVSLFGLAANPEPYTGAAEPTSLVCSGNTTLEPGQSLTCTSSVPVTQEDIDAGANLVYAADASATTPWGDGVAAPQTAVTVAVEQRPALDVSVSATPDQVTQAGESVTYRYLVSNPGNTTLSSLAFATSSFTGSGTLPPVTCPTNTMAPGASMTCIGTYGVTGSDVSAARNLVRTEVVSAKTPQDVVVHTADATATVALPSAVTPSTNAGSGRLALTGSTIAWSLVAVILAVLVLGVALVVWARRRTSKRRHS